MPQRRGSLTSSQQIAVLLSAHEMNPLLPVMNRVVYLAGGAFRGHGSRLR